MFQRIYQKLQTREGITFVASIALIVIILCMVFGGFGRHGKMRYPGTDGNRSTITVTGSGEAFAAPDIAKFTFTVSKDAKTMNEAQKMTTEQANAVIAKLGEAGIDKIDIKTEGFNAYPKYETQARSVAPCTPNYCPPWDGGKQVIVGYTVSTTYSVKVRNLDKAGDIATLITSSNVSSVDGPQFTFDDPDKISNDARAEAIEDAKVQADILARQLGVSLKKIVDFQVVNGGYPSPMLYSAKAMDAGVESAPSPEILPGETEVRVQVNITYEIR